GSGGYVQISSGKLQFHPTDITRQSSAIIECNTYLYFPDKIRNYPPISASSAFLLLCAQKSRS
ncbi:MAG: hypothetical protein ABIN36_16280, partial [Ferruginibacter sp.]